VSSAGGARPAFLKGLAPTLLAGSASMGAIYPAPAADAYDRAMTRRGAAVGSVIFLVTEPGLMGGLVPYWLTGWDSKEPPRALTIAGAVALLAGLATLAHTVIRFVVEGVGTPAPVAPTQNLVVGGLYRFVRNPMYVAVISIILGQAAILGRPVLLGYAAIFWAVVASFVRLHEEPTLAERYGAEYAAYRRAVRAWWPRVKPWIGDQARTRTDATSPSTASAPK
jgi:protein-S-isoprenylcysteine O-methyltransferase Ste14